MIMLDRLVSGLTCLAGLGIHIVLNGLLVGLVPYSSTFSEPLVGFCRFVLFLLAWFLVQILNVGYGF